MTLAEIIKKFEDTGACDEGLKYLRSQKDIEEAISDCNDLEFLKWAVGAFHCSTEYYSKCKPCWDEYDAKINSFLDECNAKVKPFRDECNAKVNSCWDEFNAKNKIVAKEILRRSVI